MILTFRILPNNLFKITKVIRNFLYIKNKFYKENLSEFQINKNEFYIFPFLKVKRNTLQFSFKTQK